MQYSKSKAKVIYEPIIVNEIFTFLHTHPTQRINSSFTRPFVHMNGDIGVNLSFVYPKIQINISKHLKMKNVANRKKEMQFT